MRSLPAALENVHVLASVYRLADKVWLSLPKETVNKKHMHLLSTVVPASVNDRK